MSGSPAADLAAVSRTFCSASYVSMYSAPSMSEGLSGTSVFAAIIRSGTGAAGSTCLRMLGGKNSELNGHPAGAGGTGEAVVMTRDSFRR